jgi:DNA-binding NarL/FixJ family response regulator
MIAPKAGVHVLEAYRVNTATVHAVPFPGAAYVEAQKALRLAAINADASATTEVSLSLLWRQLARGMSRVVDGFFAGERCYLVLSLNTGGPATAAEARRMQILEAVLGGVRQKNIAIDMKLAPSTVAMNAKLALASLGVECKPSRAHPLLILAARAKDESALAFARCSLFVGRDDRELRVIGMARPEQSLAAALPTAELAVIRALIEGLTHEEIAQRRGTSMRTIANQICAVFRRLNVSGRNELVQRLLFDRPPNESQPGRISESLMPPDMVVQESVAGLTGARQSA